MPILRNGGDAPPGGPMTGHATTFVLGFIAAASVALILAILWRQLAKQTARTAAADLRYQNMFERAAVGMSHLDAEGRWVRVNDKFCEITGYAREELIGMSFRDITHPDDMMEDSSLQRALVNGESNAASREKRYIRKDGSVVWVNATGSVIRNVAGRIDFLASMIEDITPRKNAESALHASETKLLGLQNEFAHLARVNDLGEMAAAIAHEINQPLTAIVNFLSTGEIIARRGYSEDSFADVEHLIREAADQALRAGGIVRRLREFIGQGSGSSTVERLDPLVDAAMAIALIDASSSGIAIARTRGAGQAEVLVDTLQVQQVLVNLLRNAVEALGTVPEEGRIHVTTRLSGEMVEVEIADNGPGIPADLEDRLFDPFVTSKEKGMGMGLSVCRRLIEAHDGTIAAENTPEGGARFRFALPLLKSRKTPSA